MRHRLNRLTPFLCCCLSLLPTTGGAHFPWVCLDEESQPRVFFGEGPSDQDYHVPDAVAAARFWQTDIDAPDAPLEFEPLEEEGFAGLVADAVEPRGRLKSSFVYGVYGGSKLVYYAQCFAAPDAGDWPTEPAEELDLQALLSREAGGLTAKLLWRAEPLADAKITLLHEGGGDGVSATTDAQGMATFAADAVKPGLNGLLVMQMDKEEKGEIEGASYTGATHVLTVTFDHDPEAKSISSALPRLPEAVASFGAAACDGWLYVYGGHIGTAHDHSRDNLSKSFRRAPLDGSGDWEELPMGPPLQGLALVAHGGKLYRIGGLNARNPSGDEEDLHSTDRFACYDPATEAWTDLAPLPNGRSSHNAVVIGDTLYVAGGWKLTGSDDGDWRPDALAFDLTDPGAGWTVLPEPPFRRRALAVSHVGGRLVVLCGMTDDADLSKEVFLYDPESREWTSGPEFPGVPFHGFGVAAWNEGGALYAGGMEGVLYRLTSPDGDWQGAAEFASPRFFHQLVPDGAGGLLAVAGASPTLGHTATIERLVFDAPLEAAADQ